MLQTLWMQGGRLDSPFEAGFTLEMRDTLRALSIPFHYETRDEFEQRMQLAMSTNCRPKCDAVRAACIAAKRYQDTLVLFRPLTVEEMKRARF